MSKHRAIIRAFYEEIWNKHDESQIPELLHEDFAFRGSLGQDQHGHAGFAAYVDFVHAALSDYRCEIQEMIAEGNQAFARLRFSGMHRAEFFGYQPTGKRVEWAGAAVSRSQVRRYLPCGCSVMSMAYCNSSRTTRVPNRQ